MAEIICTTKDFHKYFGPRVRNLVQSITKKRKKELKNICQDCKQNKELEAAHLKGKSRKDIIEELLEKHFIDKKNGLVKVDLDQFEKEVISAHKPLEKYFKFLCSKCHVEYDSKK